MIKHIFCDLDGTLYNNGVSDEDVKAIEEIEKENVIFHVATGRVFRQAYKMISEKFKLNGYYCGRDVVVFTAALSLYCNLFLLIIFFYFR